MTQKPSVTYGVSATEFVLEAFDFHVDADGWIRDSNDNPVMAFDDGDPITVHETVAIVDHPVTGDPVPLRESLTTSILLGSETPGKTNTGP